MNTKIQLTLTLKKRLLLFLCLVLVSFFLLSIISTIISLKFGLTTPTVRIITVLQDILLFIVPALVTAVLVTRQPATLLGIDRLPSGKSVILAIAALIFSVPAMNYVIYLNNNVPLPADIYESLRQMEDSAAATVSLLTGPHDMPNLLMSILIVGVFAGLSEELLFRGCLQRLLVTGRVNHHCAIWLSAIVFSILHVQFFGFVPRMLLGAFFGYALWYTRSLWLPILLHALNNTIYVISEWLYSTDSGDAAIDSVGYGDDYLWVVASAVLTAICLCMLRRVNLNQR